MKEIKTESFSKELEDIMKKQMEILELESIIIEKKKKTSSKDKFNSRVEWNKRRIIELKGITVEIIQPEQQGEN